MPLFPYVARGAGHVPVTLAHAAPPEVDGAKSTSALAVAAQVMGAEALGSPATKAAGFA